MLCKTSDIFLQAKVAATLHHSQRLRLASAVIALCHPSAPRTCGTEQEVWGNHIMLVCLGHAGSIMVGNRYWMPPPRQFQPMFQVSAHNQTAMLHSVAKVQLDKDTIGPASTDEDRWWMAGV